MLLPGDPGRALRLAQQLLDAPKMLNHHRGLWGYTGGAADGAPLTIQSTGLGGPSAAIVTEELIALGARRFVRVGTCCALDESVAAGDLLVAERVLARDGASRALGAPEWVLPDAALTGALAQSARPVAVVSHDLFYQRRASEWRAAGALAAELEAAAVLTVAARHGVAAACVLLAGRDELDVDALHAGELRLGRAAAAVI